MYIPWIVNRRRENLRLRHLRARFNSSFRDQGLEKPSLRQPTGEAPEVINLRPKATDVTVQFCGIGWLPHIEDAAGKLRRV